MTRDLFFTALSLGLGAVVIGLILTLIGSIKNKNQLSILGIGLSFIFSVYTVVFILMTVWRIL